MSDNAKVRVADRLAELDREVNAWSKLTVEKLQRRIASLGLKERAALADEVPLRQSLKHNIKRRNLEIESVAFSFARKGIFLERGVGRGRPAGSAKANAAARPWLEPTLPPAIDELANIIAEQYADVVVAELRFLIPGILDVKVSK